MKNIFIEGKDVYLRPASIEDAKGDWYKWLNDVETTQYLTNQFWPNTKAKQIEFVKNSLNSKERVVFSVCLKKNHKHIGQCSLSYINWVHRFADIGVIIGDKKSRKGIYALEVYRLLLQISFERFNLENIKSGASNPVAIKFHQLLGFKHIGTYKNLFLVNGKKTSLKLFSINRNTWKKNF
jgi:RimJ/RimL family protein N-acetyltransferase